MICKIYVIKKLLIIFKWNCPPGGDVMWYFPRIKGFSLSPVLPHKITSKNHIKYRWNIKVSWKKLVYIERQGALLYCILFKFRNSGIGQNYVQMYRKRIILSQSFWNYKHLFIIAVVRSCIIFVYMGTIILPQGGGSNPPGRNFLPLVFSEKTPQNTHK